MYEGKIVDAVAFWFTKIGKIDPVIAKQTKLIIIIQKIYSLFVFLQNYYVM